MTNEKVNFLAYVPDGGPDVEHAFAVEPNAGGGDCLFLALAQSALNGQRLTAAEVRAGVVDYVTSNPDIWENHKLGLLVQHEWDIQEFRTSLKQSGGGSERSRSRCRTRRSRSRNRSPRRSSSSSSGSSSSGSEDEEGAVDDDGLKAAYRTYMLKKGVYGTAEELQLAAELYKFNCSLIRRQGLDLDGDGRRVETYNVMYLNDDRRGDWPSWLYFRFCGNPGSGHWENLNPLFIEPAVWTMPCGSYTEVGYNPECNMRYLSNWKEAGGVRPRRNFSSDPKDKGRKRGGSPSSEAESPPKRSRSEPDQDRSSARKGRKRALSAPVSLEKEGRTTSSSDRKGSAEKVLECECGNPRKKTQPEDEGCGNSDNNERQRARSPSSKKACCSKDSSPSSLFENKRVLVTAGSQGLGRRLVKRFYEDRAVVFVIDNDWRALAALTVAFPGIETCCTPSCSWEETKSFIESISPLDHLVNNAGILIPSPFLDVLEKDVASTFKTNYTWLYGVAQAFAKGVIDHNCKGSQTIVNITTMFEKWALPEASLFCGTQAAVSMLTRSLALELGCHDIRVNTVKSFLPSNGVDYSCTGEENKEKADRLANHLAYLEGKGMLAREMFYDDVVNAVAFLLGPNSRSITGNELVVNSGISEH